MGHGYCIGALAASGPQATFERGHCWKGGLGRHGVQWRAGHLRGELLELRLPLLNSSTATVRACSAACSSRLSQALLLRSTPRLYLALCLSDTHILFLFAIHFVNVGSLCCWDRPSEILKADPPQMPRQRRTGDPTCSGNWARVCCTILLTSQRRERAAQSEGLLTRIASRHVALVCFQVHRLCQLAW